MLSAVVLLFVFGLHPFVSDGAEPPDVSDVKVTDVPSDFVNVNFDPTMIFA